VGKPAVIVELNGNHWRGHEGHIRPRAIPAGSPGEHNQPRLVRSEPPPPSKWGAAWRPPSAAATPGVRRQVSPGRPQGPPGVGRVRPSVVAMVGPTCPSGPSMMAGCFGLCGPDPGGPAGAVGAVGLHGEDGGGGEASGDGRDQCEDPEGRRRARAVAGHGARRSRPLTATELRRFEEHPRLLSHPLEALAFFEPEETRDEPPPSAPARSGPAASCKSSAALDRANGRSIKTYMGSHPLLPQAMP
jgi:hypothetical protein